LLCKTLDGENAPNDAQKGLPDWIPPLDRTPERILKEDSQYACARNDATVALRQFTINVSQFITALSNPFGVQEISVDTFPTM